MRKKHTNGYMQLLELLNEHPEFSAFEENFGDSEIIALGKALWKMWEEAEKNLPFDETGVPQTMEDIEFGRHTAESTKRIIQLSVEGMSPQSIALEVGKPVGSVRDVRYKYGFPPDTRTASRGYGFTKAELEAAWKEIGTLSGIARKYGTSASVVKKAMELHGVKFKVKHGAKEVSINKKEAIQKYEELKTIKSVAKHFGVSASTMSKKFKAWGINGGAALAS